MIQANSRPVPGLISQLKPISKAVICAEALDILTTIAGLFLLPQIWEANPMLVLLGGWPQLLAAKLAAVALVVLILERVKSWPRLAWAIPIAAALPSIWNTICLLAELML